ncbi:MAG: GNAT family N-acetyltransferase [Aureispira sp.]|nr:GNAT family N-acetyltransferase [Aureispira sp.]
MQKLLRTNSQNPDFIKLVQKLDADLAKRDGQEHSFYAQFNKIDALQYVVVLYENGEALGCGAIKELNINTMEAKRMYTNPSSRGKGLATIILLELEKWAEELGYKKCALETGKKQPEAIRLYSKNGYQTIPNYGQYANVENSLCFEKPLQK